MATIQVLRPDKAEPEPEHAPLAARTPLPEGAHLALIDNGKPQARELLELIAEELRGRLPIGSIEVVSKPSASVPIEAGEARALAERADLVITGLGDCGACSACSVHDAVQLEHLGVPATVVISDVFQGIVQAFSASLGAPGYHQIVVTHPISSKPLEHLRGEAARVADAAADQLAPASTRAAAPA
jgi:hypothetical protein